MGLRRRAARAITKGGIQMSTMPICCNLECRTPFCPICGKQWASASATLDGLLNYLRSHIKGQRNFIETTVNNPRWEKGRDRRIRALTKWEVWERDLTDLMERAKTMATD